MCLWNRRGDGLTELAEDIKRLAQLAYPDTPASMIETFQFLNDLSEEDM